MPPDRHGWAGLYVGGHMSLSRSRVTARLTDFPAAPPVIADGQGKIFGIYAGYNLDLPGGYVVGLEGSVDFGLIEGNRLLRNANGSIREFIVSHVNAPVSVQARMGAEVADRTLLFVGAGWAWSQFDIRSYDAPDMANLEGILNTNMQGPVFGIGVDFELTRSLAMRMDYRHFDFNKEWLRPGGVVSFETDLAVRQFRIGIAYRF